MSGDEPSPEPSTPPTEAIAEALEQAGMTVHRGSNEALAETGDEPPVVARLVVEIRSDGSRTIARGAMEDRTLGQTVALEAEAGSPQELTAMLLKGIVGSPAMTGRAVKQLILNKGRSLKQRLRRRLLPGPKPGDD